MADYKTTLFIEKKKIKKKRENINFLRKRKLKMRSLFGMLRRVDK